MSKLAFNLIGYLIGLVMLIITFAILSVFQVTNYLPIILVCVTIVYAVAVFLLYLHQVRQY
jgi:uncharacterized protein YacL